MQPTKRQQQRADTQQRLYETALHLFATQGYEATTVESIAKAAGVAKGTFFVHFPSKQAVLAYLGQLQMERLGAAVQAEAGFATADLRSQLHFIYRTLAAGVDAQPALAHKLMLVLVQGESAFDHELLSFDKLDALLQPLIVDAQARGVLRSDASAEDLTVMVRGTYFIAFTGWFQRRDEPFAPHAHRLLDLLLDGLLAAPMY